MMTEAPLRPTFKAPREGIRAQPIEVTETQPAQEVATRDLREDALDLQENLAAGNGRAASGGLMAVYVILTAVLAVLGAGLAGWMIR